MSSHSSAAIFTLAAAITFGTPLLHSQGTHSGSADQDLLELQHYTLDMDKVTRFVQTNADFNKLAKTHPQLASRQDKDAGDNPSISDVEKRLSAEPEVVSLLKQHGFTPHEFVVAEMTVFQSAFAAAAAQSGADRAKLASEAHVNPANITFMEQHKTEFEELQKKYGAKNDEKTDSGDSTE